MIRWLLAALLILSSTALAQDYPSFVGTTETSETLPLIEPPQVLTADLLSTETWQATRIRVDSTLEELRLLALTKSPVPVMKLRGESLQRDLSLIAAMAEHQAPAQAEVIQWYQARLSRQITIFMDEYASGDLPSMESVDRMIRLSTRDLNALLVRSDQERAGLALSQAEPFPAGWIPADFNDPDFAARLAPLPTERLLSDISDQVGMIEDSFRPRSLPLLPRATMELAIMARELARRDYELPITARQPFRDTALRMDVLAENIGELTDPRHRLHARRQARHLRLCLREIESYQALRRATGEQPAP